jgi:hypothetical protein
MKIEKMLKNDLPYLHGEIVGFSDDVADKLLRTGYAELHDGGAPKKAGERIPEPEGSGYQTPPGVAAAAQKAAPKGAAA